MKSVSAFSTKYRVFNDSYFDLTVNATRKSRIEITEFQQNQQLSLAKLRKNKLFFRIGPVKDSQEETIKSLRFRSDNSNPE